jgi:hypothetical protein
MTTTTRYRCSSCLFASCSHGNGQPTRKACAYCRAPFVIEHGTWGAFEWTGTGRYPEAEARRTFTSEKVADRWAAARELVVRWIPA